jgi:hypothetical protein
MKLRSLSWVGWVGFAGATALSGCDYFSNVVIPATDTTPPLAWSGVYDIQQGKYVALGIGNYAFYYTVTDPTATYLAVGATYDADGGAALIQLGGDFGTECTDGTWYQYDRQEFLTERQPGKVGDTVSNGLWTYFAVRFDQFPPLCEQNGKKTNYKLVQMWPAGADFHDNIAWGEAEIYYYGP